MPFLTQTKTNWKFIGIVAVLAAVIGVGILWFLPKQEIKMPEIKISESEEGEVDEDMTIEELENAEYYIRVFDKNVEFKDGNYEEQISESGAEFAITAGIYPDYQDEESKYKIAFGDLNNDKKDDAAVILFSNTGGSGSWIDLAVILNSNGEPIFIDSVPLGDKTRINSIIINKEIITLDMLIHGPNDAMCCPTLERIAKYKLSENKLLEVKEETADLVPSEIEGWQTYRNEEYGFEIKYPKYFENTFLVKGTYTFGFDESIYNPYYEENPFGESGGFNVAKKENVFEDWIEEYAKKQYDFVHPTQPEKYYMYDFKITRFLSLKSVQFYSTNGYREDSEISGFAFVGPEIIKIIYLEKDRYIWRFMLPDTPVYRQMLSTFRFLD